MSFLSNRAFVVYRSCLTSYKSVAQPREVGNQKVFGRAVWTLFGFGGASLTIPADKRIVIVGGGYAGIGLGGKLLKDKANFTIVDPKDSFHHNLAACRAATEPGFAEKTLIPYKDTFGEAWTQAKACEIDPNAKTIRLCTDKTISYDVLVIATGCTGPFPAKFKVAKRSREAAIADYANYANKIKDAKRVVLVGGGAVGVEVAAEIATDYPDKEVTIITPGDFLVNPKLGDHFQSRLKEMLKDIKVNVKFGEKATNLDQLGDKGPFTVQTSKGGAIDADLVIQCTGLKINSDSYTKNFATESNGAIKVNEFLQAEGQTHVFAGGDCTNVKEGKLALIAGYHADSIHDNIKRLLNNQELKPYVSKHKGMIMSVGRNYGIGTPDIEGNKLLPEFIVKRVKSSGMMVKDYWGKMNQTPPK